MRGAAGATRHARVGARCCEHGEALVGASEVRLVTHALPRSAATKTYRSRAWQHVASLWGNCHVHPALAKGEPVIKLQANRLRTSKSAWGARHE